MRKGSRDEPPASVQLIDQFLDSLNTVQVGNPLRVKERLRRRCQKLIAQLLRMEYSPMYIKTLMTKLRDDVGRKYPFALRHLHIPLEMTVANKRSYREMIAEQSVNLTSVDAFSFVCTARALVDSDRPLETLAALTMLTGRRPWELATPGAFRAVKADEALNGVPVSHQVAFCNQAKVRGREVVPYCIPLLAPADEVLYAYANFHASIEPYVSREDFDMRCGRRLGWICRNLFGLLWTPKELRALYAATVTRLFAPQSCSEVAYFAQVLGHRLASGSRVDVATATSYQKYSVSSALDDLREAIGLDNK